MKKVKDFHFKEFTVSQQSATHKVGTDGVLLGAWTDVSGAKHILDIGTGSGVIALMLAQRNSDAFIDAVEIQKNDATQAKLNFENSPWQNRLHLHHSSIQAFRPDKKYDVIVSNPPYFQNSWLPPAKARSTVRHTNDLSFEELLTSVLRLLSPSGKFSIILPNNEGTQFEIMATAQGLSPTRKCYFRSRIHKPVERLMTEFSLSNATLMEEDLVLYKEGETWSEGYRSLTKAFYLKA